MAKIQTQRPSLAWLLKEVDSLFAHRPRQIETYQYTLGRFPSRWCFRVIDDWNKWIRMNFKVDFYGDTPEQAVEAFLEYVSDNHIEVQRLQEA